MKLLWNDYEGRKGARLPPAFRLFDMRTDPTEENDLIPALLGLCTDLPRLPDPCSTVCHLNLTQFAESRETSALAKIVFPTQKSRQLLLKLLLHLQVKMHLFRHEGERDWANYQKNKNYETAAHCGVRSAWEVNTLPWATSDSGFLLVPGFCGGPIGDLNQQFESPAAAGLACSCRLSAPANQSHSCSQFWTNRDWRTLDAVDRDGTEALFSSARKGNLCEEVNDILSVTNYRSLCHEPSGQVSTAMAAIEKVITAPFHGWIDFGKKADKVPIEGRSTDWSARPSPDSHQRQFVSWLVRTNDSQTAVAHLIQSSCGNDAPYLVFTSKGLTTHPLLVCPSALRRVGARGTGFVDDSFMLAALNAIALMPGLSVRILRIIH